MGFELPLLRRILGMVAVAKLKVVDDTGEQQKAQLNITPDGPDGVQEVIDGAPRLGHYGFAYCPPDGSEAVVVFVGGRRSSPIIIATGNRATRTKNLKPGEAMLVNELTGSWAKMDVDGRLHINCDIVADHALTAEQVVVGTGASGTFTTPTGLTVTVQDGIVTNIF